MAYLKKTILSVLLVSVLGLTACASSRKTTDDMTAEQIYNVALDLLIEDREYSKAIAEFDKIDRLYPYSKWAIKAQIMMAFTHYVKREYDDAVVVLDRFIQLYPGNRYAPYAYYLKAMCFYDQVSDPRRDQDMTQMALEAFSVLIGRFPDTPYAKDARVKTELADNYLAGHEMQVGRYYLRQGVHLAALNRFLTVVQNYQHTEQIEEALYRLTETYLSLGLREEAQRAASVLGYNYPKGKWYKKAYALMNKNHLKIGDSPSEEKK